MFVTPAAGTARKLKGCSYKSISLYGKVKEISAFGDFKARVKDIDTVDLMIKVVDAFPIKYDEWQFVDSLEDFTVEFVDGFWDFEIVYINSFWGLPHY